MQIIGWCWCKQTRDNGIWSFFNTPIPLHRKAQLQASRSSSSYTNKAHKYAPLSQIPCVRFTLKNLFSFSQTLINLLNKISINDTREGLPLSLIPMNAVLIRLFSLKVTIYAPHPPTRTRTHTSTMAGAAW